MQEPFRCTARGLWRTAVSIASQESRVGSIERKWKHLNLWQYETILSARVPRVKCDKCGVHQGSVPWAREGSGFTLLFEAMAMLLSNHMSVAEASGMLGEDDTRIRRIVSHYVGKTREACDWSVVRRVAVDEVSRKKGHVYATNFLDLDTGKLLFMAPGKDASTLGAFAEELTRRGGRPEQIEELAMDMSKAFRKGAAEHFPAAKISFDRFHVMMLAGVAVDAVRKEVAAREGGLEKGAMWSLRGNASRLSQDAAGQRKRLFRDYAEIGRAMGLREFLKDTWNYATRELAEEHLGSWCSWAARCRLEPLKKLARSVREHWDGILNYFNNWTASAAIESLHSKLQLARSRARGFRETSTTSGPSPTGSPEDSSRNQACQIPSPPSSRFTLKSDAPGILLPLSREALPKTPVQL